MSGISLCQRMNILELESQIYCTFLHINAFIGTPGPRRSGPVDAARGRGRRPGRGRAAPVLERARAARVDAVEREEVSRQGPGVVRRRVGRRAVVAVVVEREGAARAGCAGQLEGREGLAALVRALRVGVARAGALRAPAHEPK